MSESSPPYVDRRTTIKWVLAAATSLPLMKGVTYQPTTASPAAAPAGYGTDPDLGKSWQPGELWPLSFTPEARRTAVALCDLIVPADHCSPSASAVGVVDFIDEWISAPYLQHQDDRALILAGFDWLDQEAGRRFATTFAALDIAGQSAICDDICYRPNAGLAFTETAKFFARYRDLTAGGFYTSPAGRKDLQYVGNVPLATFDGPPREVLEAAKLL